MSGKKTNGVRVSNREIYDTLLEVKEAVLKQNGKVKVLEWSNKLQWGLLVLILGWLVVGVI